jgi:hypothetical protein
MLCRRTRVLFMKSEALGRSSEETLGRSVVCMDNLNLTETLTLTKWTDVRAASENTIFGACHVERRKNTSWGIHIYLEYKFVGAQRRLKAFGLESD